VIGRAVDMSLPLSSPPTYFDLDIGFNESNRYRYPSTSWELAAVEVCPQSKHVPHATPQSMSCLVPMSRRPRDRVLGSVTIPTHLGACRLFDLFLFPSPDPEDVF